MIKTIRPNLGKPNPENSVCQLDFWPFLNVYILTVDAEALIFLIVILPLSGMLILEKKEKLTTHFPLS